MAWAAQGTARPKLRFAVPAIGSVPEALEHLGFLFKLKISGTCLIHLKLQR